MNRILALIAVFFLGLLLLGSFGVWAYYILKPSFPLLSKEKDDI